MAFQKKRITGDKLGVYPQYMQVPAIPERRFLKTSRLLTVLTIVLLSINFFFISYIYFLSIFRKVATPTRFYPFEYLPQPEILLSNRSLEICSPLIFLYPYG